MFWESLGLLNLDINLAIVEDSGPEVLKVHASGRHYLLDCLEG